MLGEDSTTVCRQIGYMAHPSLLYDEMCGMENLRYFASLYGVAGDERCAEPFARSSLTPR